jgi:hypothetical protein
MKSNRSAPCEFDRLTIGLHAAMFQHLHPFLDCSFRVGEFPIYKRYTRRRRGRKTGC